MTGLHRLRWLQRLWAGLLGYFWLPCPECGQLFGGHEMARNWAVVYKSNGNFVVCRDCGPAVAARNMIRIRKDWLHL